MFLASLYSSASAKSSSVSWEDTNTHTHTVLLYLLPFLRVYFHLLHTQIRKEEETHNFSISKQYMDKTACLSHRHHQTFTWGHNSVSVVLLGSKFSATGLDRGITWLVRCLCPLLIKCVSSCGGHRGESGANELWWACAYLSKKERKGRMDEW